MKIGYARVSTREQNPDLQLDALKRAGCERIFQDVASGSKTARPALDEMLGRLRAGDVLVIWKLDRMGRSLKHLVELVGDLVKREIGLVSLNDPIDTSSAQGRLVFNLFASLAEFEREVIRERTHAGLSAARARGRVGGRPKGLSSQALATAMAAETLYREQRLSVAAIAKQLHLSKSTLYIYLRRRGVAINAYEKSAQPKRRPPGSATGKTQNTGDEKIATIHLDLRVENNSKFVRGKKKVIEAIEQFHLQAYGGTLLRTGEYELKIPYRTDEKLDQTLYELMQEMDNEADLRHCFTESSASMPGTDRSW